MRKRKTAIVWCDLLCVNLCVPTGLDSSTSDCSPSLTGGVVVTVFGGGNNHLAVLLHPHSAAFVNNLVARTMFRSYLLHRHLLLLQKLHCHFHDESNVLALPGWQLQEANTSSRGPERKTKTGKIAEVCDCGCDSVSVSESERESLSESESESEESLDVSVSVSVSVSVWCDVRAMKNSFLSTKCGQHNQFSEMRVTSNIASCLGLFSNSLEQSLTF